MKTNKEMEEKLMDDFCVMFERASRKFEPIDWGDRLIAFINSELEAQRKQQNKLHEIAINNLITDVNTARKEEREKIYGDLVEVENRGLHQVSKPLTKDDLDNYFKKI